VTWQRRWAFDEIARQCAKLAALARDQKKPLSENATTCQEMPCLLRYYQANGYGPIATFTGSGDCVMKPRYWIALSVMVLILVGYYARIYFLGRNTPPLVALALSAPTLEERMRAAVKITMLKDGDALPQLRRLAAESKDPEILVITVNCMNDFNDMQSMPLMFAAMNHPEQPVREAAFKFVLRFYDGALPKKLTYQVDDPPEQRAQVASALKHFFDNPPPPAGLNKNPYPPPLPLKNPGSQ
jgi:hypothetical protein